MATHGRYRDVCVSLACFLQQSYPNRELVILNNHPEPLHFVHPLVRICNEPGHPTLGDCRNRLLELAAGEFVRTWDDDDFYLPWTLTQGVEHIRGHAAWKPARSWFLNGDDPARLTGNSMEASILFRADVVRKYGYGPGPGDEHVPLMQKVAANDDGVVEQEMGIWSSYAYRWGQGNYHASGDMSGSPEERTRRWMTANQDVRPGLALSPNNKQVSRLRRFIARSVPDGERKHWLRQAWEA
jgi:hypothetical protein